jgi:TonB-dependent Receptor Plug Domain
MQGFKVFEKSDLRLSATDRLNAGVFELELGGTAEVVNVSAGAGDLQLQANSGERSDLITGNQLNNLALNGRNILDFVKVVPGVATDGTGIAQFNVNGTRANQHEFTIDGASNVDTGNNGGTHVTLNPDAVAEMKILTSNYQAEFGKAGGGQVVVTTKSGSREFHGNGRYFGRNEALNANSWSSSTCRTRGR